MISHCRVLVGTECNFTCSYCCNNIPEIKNNFRHVALENFVPYLDQYKTVSITGGEPLIRINLAKTLYLIEKLLPLEKNIRLYTNLSILPSDSIQYLVDNVDSWNIGVHDQSKKLIHRLSVLMKLGAKSVMVSIQAKDEEYWRPLADEHGFMLKIYELGDCDIFHREDWYQLESR